MTQKSKHTEPAPSSKAAAYGSEHVESMASHGVALSHTVTKLTLSSSWISDASWELSYHTERSRRIDQRQTGHDIRFKFTGKELDLETGYTYFGARYYDGGLSVWFARPPKLHSLHKKVYLAAKRKCVDPLADKYLSTSLFMYVRGNPVLLVDPNGMWKGKVDKSGKTTYVAEKGDTKETFREQYSDLSRKDVEAIFKSKDSKLKYSKKDGNLIAGSSVTGDSVKVVTGSELLKLNFKSSLATGQRKVDQMLFAYKYERSHNSATMNFDNYFTGLSGGLGTVIKGNVIVLGKNLEVTFDIAFTRINTSGLDAAWMPIRRKIGKNYYGIYKTVIGPGKNIPKMEIRLKLLKPDPNLRWFEQPDYDGAFWENNLGY